MRLIEQLISVVAPDHCLDCEAEGRLICYWCAENAVPEFQNRCYICNSLSGNDAICAKCRRKSPLNSLYIRTEYTGLPKELVFRMKLNYSGSAADLIGEELANTIPALPPETIVVHVPTVSGHVRERGFDHSKRIARRMSKVLSLRELNLLARIGQTRQVGSSRLSRMQQIRGGYLPKQVKIIKNANILLVDDVLTTGATIEEAARTLKKAGAKRIDAVVFARAK